MHQIISFLLKATVNFEFNSDAVLLSNNVFKLKFFSKTFGSTTNPTIAFARLGNNRLMYLNNVKS